MTHVTQAPGRARRRAVATLAALLVLVLATAPVSGQGTDRQAWLRQINTERLRNGLAPLAYSGLLERAAQPQAAAMADRELTGLAAGDVDAIRRAADAGYGAWAGSRRYVFEQLAAGQRFDEALREWFAAPQTRKQLLDPRVREAGIGAASRSGTLYLSLMLGAQPNVLPIFINDGASATSSPNVAVRLTQEDVAPVGDTNAIGSVIEVRLSSRGDIGDAAWRRYENILPFTLNDAPGAKTLYVQMRDATGRIVLATGNIVLDPAARPDAPIGLGITAADETPVPLALDAVAPSLIITDPGTPIPLAIAATVRAQLAPSPAATAAAPAPSGPTATPLVIAVTMPPAFVAPTRVNLPTADAAGRATAAAAALPTPAPPRADETIAAIALPWLLLAQGAIIAFALALLWRMRRPHS